MSRPMALLRFLWDFVVGDDWRVCAAVVAGLGASAALSGTGAVAWWLLPMIVSAILALSVLTSAERAAK